MLPARQPLASSQTARQPLVSHSPAAHKLLPLANLPAARRCTPAAGQLLAIASCCHCQPLGSHLAAAPTARQPLANRSRPLVSHSPAAHKPPPLANPPAARCRTPAAGQLLAIASGCQCQPLDSHSAAARQPLDSRSPAARLLLAGRTQAVPSVARKLANCLPAACQLLTSLHTHRLQASHVCPALSAQARVYAPRCQVHSQQHTSCTSRTPAPPHTSCVTRLPSALCAS